MANGEIVVSNVTDNPVGRLVCFKLLEGFKIIINKFYVYEWYNVDSGYVFYIGKGCEKRYKLSCKSVRNKYFLSYKNKHLCNVRIVCSGLSETDAFDLEIKTIDSYKLLGQCCCNLTSGGEGVSGYNHSNETKLKLSKTHIGKQNSQYGISLKERVGNHYDEYLKNKSIVFAGENNPNYRNTTLKEKYINNPELAKEKQSRPRSQNGRATQIQLYNQYMVLEKEFLYIGECCEYLHKNYGFSNNPEIIRAGIRKSIKNDVPYKGFKFIKL